MLFRLGRSVAVTLPPRFEKELEELRGTLTVDVAEEGDSVLVTIRAFPLGDGYNKAASDLLLQIPRSYPDAAPDMFWLEQDVTLASGAIPQSAEATATIAGRSWRRFSWHRASWNPSVDNLHGQLEFIRRRLSEKK